MFTWRYPATGKFDSQKVKIRNHPTHPFQCEYKDHESKDAVAYCKNLKEVVNDMISQKLFCCSPASLLSRIDLDNQGIPDYVHRVTFGSKYFIDLSSKEADDFFIQFPNNKKIIFFRSSSQSGSIAITFSDGNGNISHARVQYQPQSKAFSLQKQFENKTIDEMANYFNNKGFIAVFIIINNNKRRIKLPSVVKG